MRFYRCVFVVVYLMSLGVFYTLLTSISVNKPRQDLGWVGSQGQIYVQPGDFA